MLTYQRSVQLPPQVDESHLLRHVATCLQHVEARNICVNNDSVVFTGGVFRMVTTWNVLVPFDRGEFAVSADSRTLSYRLSYRHLLLISTVMVVWVGMFMFVSHLPVPFLLLLPLMWGWLFGANLALGKNRFDRFARRSLDSFQLRER